MIPQAAVDWLLDGDEPAARWIALTRLLDRPSDDPDVEAAHDAVVADPTTRNLISRLPDWHHPEPIGGHNSASYAPNLLGLLADMGIRSGDDPTVDATVDALLVYSDSEGRMASPAIIKRIGPDPVLSALLCDSHAIIDILVRFGRGEDPVVRRALDRMAADIADTSQGRAWPCLPSNGFRGPGRKSDTCPMVTVEALRILAALPPDRRPLPPAEMLTLARTLLGIWSGRSDAKPYMFGHGLAFKTTKWPPFWYNALAVLDVIGRYPDLWIDNGGSPDSAPNDTPDTDGADRRAIVELAACLIAYNLGADGRVTPTSCYRGFEDHSFGQKKQPSPFSTSIVLATLRPFETLWAEIESVDVLSLGSSKGGTGTAKPPKSG